MPRRTDGPAAASALPAAPVGSGGPGAAAPPAAVGAGIGFMVLSVSLFAVMDGTSKFLTGDLTVVQVVWARFVFFLLPLLALTGPRRWRDLARTRNLGGQLGRGLLPVVASLLIVTGLTHLPLTGVTVILFLSPLFVTALAIPLLGERVTALGWAAVVAGFLGVLVVAWPGAGTFVWAALLPLAAAFVMALFQIATRLVRDDDPLSTLFYTGAVGTALMTLAVPFFWEPPSFQGWVLLAAAGLLHGLANYCLILAFARAPASTLAPFAYVQIVAALLFGLAVFGEVPDAATLVGAAVIALAGVVALRAQRPA